MQNNRIQETITIDTSAAIERGFIAAFDGWIESVSCAVNVAVTVATTNITVEIDGVAVTGVAFGITTARAVGYGETDKPTALSEFRKGQYVSVVGDGGGDAGNVSVTLLLNQK